jgi:hypothetical protein
MSILFLSQQWGIFCNERKLDSIISREGLTVKILIVNFFMNVIER